MTYRFFIASLAFLATVVACSPAHVITSKKTYQDYDIVQSQQIRWLDILNQQEENYIVFIYSETCGYCHDMLDEIVDFATERILPTYFVNSSIDRIQISDDYGIGIMDINDLSIKGTPSIIEVNEQMVVANVPGIDQCLSYLNEKRLVTNYIL